MKSPVTLRGKPRSLRIRLLLWYGTLLAVALGLFAVLMPVLTTNAIEQNVDNDVMAEARVASLSLRPELSAQSPYWPTRLSLDVIDTYRDPGVVVEILDARDHIHYRSGNDINTTIPISADASSELPLVMPEHVESPAEKTTCQSPLELDRVALGHVHDKVRDLAYPSHRHSLSSLEVASLPRVKLVKEVHSGSCCLFCTS